MSRSSKLIFPAIMRCSIFVLCLTAFAVFSTLAVNAQGEIASDDAVAVFNQAQELHEKGDLPGAIALYDKAIKIMPEFPEAEYQRANALLTIGKSDDAEKGFRRAVELRPDWSLALTSLGSILVQKDKYAEAETTLSKAIELEPQNPPALTALIDLRLKTKAAPVVLQDLLIRITELTSKAKPTAGLWSAKAALEIALNKRDAAKASLNSSIALEPNNRYALFQVADIALAEGDLDRAKNVAGLIEKTGQSKDELSYLKARIYAREGNGDEALKQLDAMSKPTTAGEDLRSKIAMSSSTNTAEIEKQLAADPKNGPLLGRLCILYRKDDPAKALDYCRRASEAEPNNMSHAVGFGAALVQAKQYEQAVILFQKIIKIAPDNWTAHANLATALFQLMRYAEAKPEYEWLTNKQPKSSGAFFFLALVHDHLKEYMDAMANYQEFLRLADPEQNKLDIEKVNLRLPTLAKDIKTEKKKN